MSASQTPSTYLDFLPIIYQERTADAGPGEPNFVGVLLRAFEEILSGAGTEHGPSLNASVDALPRLFSAQDTPPEFLDWLSGWVAVIHRADLEEEERRLFLQHAVPLYRWRGTRTGLRRIVRLYTGMEPTITEPGPDLRIGETTVVGAGRIGGGLPHTFEVRVRLSDEVAARAGEGAVAERARRTHEVLRALIESEKPAHTVCTLVVEVPTMQIGVRSTIGLSTLLGGEAG